MTTLDDDPFAPSVDYLAWLAKQVEDATTPEPEPAPPAKAPYGGLVGQRQKKKPPLDPRAKLRATANFPFWAAPPLRQPLGEETPKGQVHRLRETEHPDDDT